ncbi:ribosomal protein l16p/L10e domain-containing protein [Ditylenchus destructor]|nr:ribosomal protein l16p/L10e domain-containing protein [Ditylenchus destructor]
MRGSLPLRGEENITPPYTHITTFENVIFPINGEMKLATLPAEPIYDPTLGEKKYTSTRRLVEMRGPEAFQHRRELIYKQYGLAAVDGGLLSAKALANIQETVNTRLRFKQFAVWRVEAPWLPQTRFSKGRALGGGKGKVNHYGTPIRPGRIILELGGFITEMEARAYLATLYNRYPFRLECVSHELLERRKAIDERVANENENPLSWEKVIRYNMQNCHTFLSPHDIIWKCKYRTK